MFTILLFHQELQKSAQTTMLFGATPGQRPVCGGAPGPTSEQVLAVENGLKQVDVNFKNPIYGQKARNILHMHHPQNILFKNLRGIIC